MNKFSVGTLSESLANIFGKDLHATMLDEVWQRSQPQQKNRKRRVSTVCTCFIPRLKHFATSTKVRGLKKKTPLHDPCFCLPFFSVLVPPGLGYPFSCFPCYSPPSPYHTHPFFPSRYSTEQATRPHKKLTSPFQNLVPEQEGGRALLHSLIWSPYKKKAELKYTRHFIRKAIQHVITKLLSVILASTEFLFSCSRLFLRPYCRHLQDSLFIKSVSFQVLSAFKNTVQEIKNNNVNKLSCELTCSFVLSDFTVINLGEGRVASFHLTSPHQNS